MNTNADITNNPNYKILKRVPESYSSKKSSLKTYKAAIIDLETMGIDHNKDAIIELGMLIFSYSKDGSIHEIFSTYNELNDPNKPIPEVITKLTGITDKDVKGRQIDWNQVIEHLKDCHLILCHNSNFDRKFLEHQTPPHVQDIIAQKPFACTVKDINWNERGYESAKLDYLNFKLGFFYDSHRAITDCWATFNLLSSEPGAFEELTINARKSETIICAEKADFSKKELLKERGYFWSDGSGKLPKCWHTSIQNDLLEEEFQYLDEFIYNKAGTAKKLKKYEVNAYNRYSLRLSS